MSQVPPETQIGPESARHGYIDELYTRAFNGEFACDIEPAKLSDGVHREELSFDNIDRLVRIIIRRPALDAPPAPTYVDIDSFNLIRLQLQEEGKWLQGYRLRLKFEEGRIYAPIGLLNKPLSESGEAAAYELLDPGKASLAAAEDLQAPNEHF